MMPAALALESEKPLDRRARHHRQRDALLNVGHLAVPGRQQRRAHRARPLALRAEHVVVDHERIFVAEQIGKGGGPGFADKSVILLDLAAGRQFAALLGDALDMAAKLDLLRQQRLAGAAIFGALIGKTNVAGTRQLGGGFQGGTGMGLNGGTAHGMTSFRLVRMGSRWKTFGQAADRQGRGFFLRVASSSNAVASPGLTGRRSIPEPWDGIEKLRWTEYPHWRSMAANAYCSSGGGERSSTSPFGPSSRSSA